MADLGTGTAGLADVTVGSGGCLGQPLVFSSLVGAGGFLGKLWAELALDLFPEPPHRDKSSGFGSGGGGGGGCICGGSNGAS